jgi:hypothetical protein
LFLSLSYISYPLPLLFSFPYPFIVMKVPIFVAARSKGSNICTSLARESDSARVPMSQTRPCVGRKVGSQLMSVVKLIRVKLAEPDSRGRLVRVWAP